MNDKDRDAQERAPVVEGPFRATTDDFDSLVECASECFPAERDSGGVVARWPQTYRREAQHLSRFLFMKAAGKIVSNVTYVDQALAVGGGEVRVAGLAEVMTWPSYRSRGLMSRLLRHAIERIREEGYAFSDLGGDRLRYARYGWERAGREWRFTVTDRSLSAKPAVPGFAVRPYRGLPKEVEGIAAIHDAEPFRVKRTREQYVRLLGRCGKEAHLAAIGPRIASYVVVGPDAGQHKVFEFGGAPEGIHAILRRIIRPDEAKTILIWSPWSHPANDLFFEVSDRWEVGCSRMIRLFDLAATLRGFESQIRERSRRLGLRGGRRVTLRLEESAQRAGLELTESGARVTEAVEGSAEIALPQCRMARFLFGPASPSQTAPLPPEAAFLDALLPLDFHIWANDAV